MIESTTNLKHKCIIKLLYGCGLRLSELLNLKITDIDSANMVVRIRNSKGNSKVLWIYYNTLLFKQSNRHFEAICILDFETSLLLSPKTMRAVCKSFANRPTAGWEALGDFLHPSFT